MPSISLSVIIPVADYEAEIPKGLIADLKQLPESTEVIFVGCQHDTQSVLFSSLSADYKVIYASIGRAQQMNQGASQAKGKFLWFLHLDSRFSADLLTQLLDNLKRHPEHLHYNLLQFSTATGLPMKLNACGANWRSRILGIPFGDQGFAIAKKLFQQVGSYPTSAPHGEDHLWLWQARQHGVKLYCNPHKLRTSARKYQEKGWCYLTLKYQSIWLRQALPEYWKLVKKRYFSDRCQR